MTRETALTQKSKKWLILMRYDDSRDHMLCIGCTLPFWT